MDKLAILGDSFCRPVPGLPHFSHMLGIEVSNYSWAGASNHNICQQAVEALKTDVDAIFVSFTSSVRQSLKLSENTGPKNKKLYSRYYRAHNNTSDQDLLTATYYQTQRDYPLPDNKTKLFKNYHKEFADLAHQIDENWHMICSCLSRLATSGKEIIWSQGGFEHPSFGTVQEWDFERWQECKIDLNLWDHIDTPESPQHIINPQTHRWIADQILKSF
jgi:hypothetical protein